MIVHGDSFSIKCQVAKNAMTPAFNETAPIPHFKDIVAVDTLVLELSSIGPVYCLAVNIGQRISKSRV